MVALKKEEEKKGGGGRGEQLTILNFVCVSTLPSTHLK